MTTPARRTARGWRRAAVPGAVSLAVAAGAAVPATAAWTTPVTVMPALRTDGEGVVLRPALGSRADRSALVAWTSPAARRWFVAVRRAKLHPTRGWTAPATLGAGKGAPLVGASLRVAGDDAAVAWSARARTADPERVRVWLSRPGTGATVDGPATPGRTFQPVAAVTSGGEVVAVWQEPGGPWAGVRDPVTGAWSRARLDPSVLSADWSMAAAPSGVAVAAWRGLGTGPGPPVVAAAVRPPGGVFGPPEHVDASYDLPVVALRRDGTAAVLLTGAGIRARSRGPGGWSAPVAVSGDRVPAGTPVSVAALPDGRLVAAYRAVEATTTRVMVVSERVPGGAWNPPVPLAPAGRGLGDPQLAASPGGRLAVVWLRRGRVIARLRPAGAARWTRAEPVSPAGRACRAPAVTVGADGRAVAAFPCLVRGGAAALLAAVRPRADRTLRSRAARPRRPRRRDPREPPRGAPRWGSLRSSDARDRPSMIPDAAGAGRRPATGLGPGAGSCRGCPVRCERVVYPSGCLESGCPRLYTYERDGRAVMGCLEKVFRVEIDVEGFRAMQRTRAGFGALRVSREPLEPCRCAIERTFDHRPHGECVNPGFLDSAPVTRV